MTKAKQDNKIIRITTQELERLILEGVSLKQIGIPILARFIGSCYHSGTSLPNSFSDSLNYSIDARLAKYEGTHSIEFQIPRGKGGSSPDFFMMGRPQYLRGCGNYSRGDMGVPIVFYQASSLREEEKLTKPRQRGNTTADMEGLNPTTCSRSGNTSFKDGYEL
jgi:hypothetical protein